MSLIIYQLEHSPYCIPITRALEALGVPFEVRNVSNATRREVIEASGGAYYQVPLLVDDGKAIYESSAESIDVARYVDREFAGGRLFPAALEGWQQITIRYIENDVEGVTFRLVDPSYLQSISDPVERTMIVRHKERKFGRGCVEQWAGDRDALAAETEKLLEPFDLALQHRPFLFGETPVYSDFALYGILGNLTYRSFNTLPVSQASLGRWFDRMSKCTYSPQPRHQGTPDQK